MVITTSDSLTASVVRIFGLFGGDVDADFRHRLDRGGVDLVRGLGAGGADLDPSPAEVVRNPAAIWERPALWTQTNRTVGFLAVSVLTEFLLESVGCGSVLMRSSPRTTF